MKLSLISKAAIVLSLAALFSCAKKESSSVTGWAYNNPKEGGFEVMSKYQQPTPPGMVFIEGGTFTMGRTDDDIMGDWNNIPRRVTVTSFYMDQCEISNLNWNEYLHWTKVVFHNNPAIIDNATPDTLVWRSEMSYNEPYVEYYFSHVAYNNYPVVGVNWEQANDYCAWRTDRINEHTLYSNKIIELPDFESVKDDTNSDEIRNNVVFSTKKYLINPEYNPEEGKKPKTDLYAENRKVNHSDGLLFSDVRLPTEAEWEYAAYGISAREGEENVAEKQKYPWNGNQLRNPDKKYRGQMQANFVRGSGDMMGLGGKLNDKATIPTTVNAYWPNEFGLYNMAGNVNEWVMDVYRPLTTEDANEYNPFRGNEYKSPQMVSNTVDGVPVRIPVIDSLGRVKMVIPVEKDSLAAYVKYDVRNFKDGDARSGRNAEMWKVAMDPDLASKALYDPDSPEEGLLAPKFTNTTRVYKGGSWKDRAHWLNPGNRRYLEQTKATNDLGFRCAMSKVGAEAAVDRK